jgi:hypothetical protein
MDTPVATGIRRISAYGMSSIEDERRLAWATIAEMHALLYQYALSALKVLH